jgi:hypothetical protein
VNVIELFAGSCSFSDAAQARGHKTFTTDNGKDLFTLDHYSKIDLVDNVLFLEPEFFTIKPDVIWASPPCTYFSISSIGHHWNKDNTPKSTEAILGVRLVQKTFELINELKPQFYFIENPLGKLRKLEFMNDYKKQTVTYCQYGDKRMKPTDIWTDSSWVGRPRCNYGDDCHESAPRGSSWGTQGLGNSFERSRVPEELCIEIIKWLEVHCD